MLNKDQEQLNTFLSALTNKINNEVPKDLVPYISSKDLKTIFQHMSTKSSYFATMNRGDALRIKKGVGNPMKRTVTVFRAEDGEYHLILETKMKKADSTKFAAHDVDKPPIMAGTEKYGKFAWRIDTEQPQRWISLRTNAPNIREEYEMMKKLQHPCIDSFILGTEYEVAPGAKHVTMEKVVGRIQRQIFAPAALGNLATVAKDFTLTVDDKYKILKDIVDGLSFMHSRRYVHQDVKPENILIYYDKNSKQYSAKISDFGLTAKLPARSLPLATLNYASPEIFYAHLFYSDDEASNFAYFFNNSRYHVGARDIAMKKTYIPPSDFATPNPLNDSWAVGILADKLFLGELIPDEVEELIAGLLKQNRNDRLKCEEALKSLNAFIAAKAAINLKLTSELSKEKSALPEERSTLEGTSKNVAERVRAIAQPEPSIKKITREDELAKEMALAKAQSKKKIIAPLVPMIKPHAADKQDRKGEPGLLYSRPPSSRLPSSKPPSSRPPSSRPPFKL